MSIDSSRKHEDDNNKVVERRSEYRGQTIVKAKALKHVAGQVTADTLGVNPDNVKVSIHDDESQLGFSLETPLSESDVIRCSVREDTTVFSLCESARQTITKRTEHITGHHIGDINMIIAGVEKEPKDEGRVR
ncbi:MAG: hypothetical protein Q4P66_07205 [Actinomycetaceae bacterium]|nr:hypothetical protein [Actinomycetaceae bacterium]